MDPVAPGQPGSSLGEFRLQSVLGEGGSGIVYDATWGPRRVALKVLHPSLVSTEKVRAQFLSEAHTLQTIAHPSVVKVLSVGELPDGRPYLAMERLDGETLASVLARGPLELGPALELFAELCAAVSALHTQGLIHRDLKPENVFIVGGKHAVLLDFGIAKDVAAPASTTTMDGGVRGTPAYMAPERFFGQPAAIATDLYELAVTLYAMLAGRLPWDDLSDPEARLSPRPLVELAEVPEDLDVEIRRALSTRAQNRPVSAAVLLDAVRVAAGSAAPSASETARMRPAGKDAALQPTITAERPRPWFAERQNTTDRGKTPLAWAPTAPAPGAAVPPARRRTPWIVGGGVAVVALAGGVAWWQLRGAPEDATTAPVAASVTSPVTAPRSAPGAVVTASTKPDPWGDPGPSRPPPPPLPTSGPEVSVAVAQAELARALPHLPADTSFLVTALVGQLARDDRFSVLFDKLAHHPKLEMMLGMLPPCVRPLISGSEWFAFGSAGFEADKQGTLIVRGRWQRADVERCFMVTTGKAETLAMTDGTKILQLPEIGWVDFLDANTLYISVRQDLAAAQVHDNVLRARGLTARTRTLITSLPADRALTFVVDGSGGLAWPGDPLPKGSDAAGVVRVFPEGVSFQLAMDVKSEAAADKLVATIRPQLEPLFGNQAAGRLVVGRKQTTVKITGELTSLMFGIVTSSVSSLP